MKKHTVFIGSSHEGLKDAEKVRALLCSETVEAKLWTEFFEASSLTFEALEDMLEHCCAAIFVVRPDDSVRHIVDKGTSKDQELHMARANVLLEFGLVAGRLGRRNVAVCRLGNADLPSDLAAMTVIDVDTCSDSGCATLADAAMGKLKRWTERLMDTTDGIPRTSVFHGYSGRWEFELSLSTWRGIAIKEPSYAVVSGSIGLFISATGLNGTGNAWGTMSFRLQPPEGSEPKASRRNGDLQVSHEIRNVICRCDGSIRFTSRLEVIMPLRPEDPAREEDPARPELSFSKPTLEPWTFVWELAPNGKPRELTGTLKTGGAGMTEGSVTLTQDQSTSY